MQRRGVVVVGVDAMSPALACELARDARMPNLARLLETGACSETRNPPGLVVGGVWPTLTTGVWPSTHGFYSERQIVSGTYEARVPTPAAIPVPRVWDVLSDHGRLCAVLDVPLSAPSPDFHGIHLAEWGAHDRFLDAESTPAGFVADIESQFGPYPVQPKCDDYTRRGDRAGLLDALHAGIDVKERLAASVLRERDWDLLWVVFAESHCVGHNFWGQHDNNHPKHDPALRRELGDPVVSVYEHLDAALGRLLDDVSDDAIVIVVLSHGMGPHYDGGHLLAEILLRLDVADDGPQRFRSVQERVRRRWHRRSLNTRGARPVLSERRYFKVPNNDLYGGIRVNLEGREPRGRVNPGRELEQVLTDLREDLLELENPDTDGPLVREVFRSDEVYAGPFLHSLPDLIVAWNWDAPIDAARSPKIGTIRSAPTATRTGDHRPNGLVIVRGHGVRPGALPPEVAAVDLAPTIAALVGVQLPAVDGKPIDALVDVAAG